jgi:hypothetical protein
MGRPGRSFFEAPFRAQEYLSRLQAEMAFANINSGSVSDLQNQAQELLSNVNTVPAATPSPTTAVAKLPATPPALPYTCWRLSASGG